MPLFQALKIGKIMDDGDYLFKDVSFSIEEGETIVVRGPSGCGKSTLLKALAQLIIYDEGKPFLNGKAPEQMGIPPWRTLIQYVPQRPPLLPGTPHDFWNTLTSFSAQRSRQTSEDIYDDPVEIAAQWNVPRNLWTSEFSTLSGGEVQRITLAIAVALNPAVLLLDEPTSALDQENTRLVEETLKGRRSAKVWVTHSPEQAERVAGQTLWVGGVPGENVVVQGSGNGEEAGTVRRKAPRRQPSGYGSVSRE
ncbi:ATP-binding cassette transporter [Saitoella complicata NRRL Y-17804]|uniref:ABC transporter domain-containing protein n=1 Tax=Saitoella complicata (strain BCRC 22490 / CBS 7301 / JCM 7358 / NBRC 10748 / NRRL Y-17804) TaxID=698492 RepID=A0A0E9NC61_SAICN|nr:ATP-binding cassette transporter [Saitoella complicata NRRL Y-17804]ODQ53806.1 ATP-binding cassette transporter [Saitoella complicata NRRL Y-17804]GAO46995.1 hypothetical protein G7K_1209-t1 [Saitoella complicata NRRL Y-17804]